MQSTLDRLNKLIVALDPLSLAGREAIRLSQTDNLDSYLPFIELLEGHLARKSLNGAALRAEDAAALLREPSSSVSWMIENVWTASSRGFIAGHPGVGKTWVALDMLLSVVSGLPFLGAFAVPKAVNGLLIEEESSRESLKRRLSLLAGSHNLTPADLAGKLFCLTRQFFKVTNPAHLADLARLVEAHSIGFIVMDSFRTVHDAKESSSDEMAIVLEKIARFQQDTGVSILLIHHLKKSGAGEEKASSGSVFESMRGSSHIWAWRDCVIGMEATDDPFAASCQFQFRDAEPTAPILVKRDLAEDGSYLRLLVERQEDWPDFKEDCDQILACLRASFDPLSANKLREKLKLRKTAILASLRFLLGRKLIIQVGSGPHTSWALATGSEPVGNQWNR